MQQGICVDPSSATVQVKGATYFLFSAGDNYYASRFPKEGANTGCFPSKLFRLVDRKSWSPEPPEKEIHLEQNKVYVATLVWQREGYKSTQLKPYTIKPKGRTHCFFYDNGELLGCFPLHWFEGFQEIKAASPVINLEKSVTETLKNVFEPESFEQLKLF